MEIQNLTYNQLLFLIVFLNLFLSLFFLLIIILFDLSKKKKTEKLDIEEEIIYRNITKKTNNKQKNFNDKKTKKNKKNKKEEIEEIDEIEEIIDISDDIETDDLENLL